MKRILAVSAAFAFLAAQVWADSITVPNFSFELPGTGKIQGWDNPGNDIPGWSSDTTATDSGVESDWPGHTEGVWTGFVYNYDSSVWNLTGHQIAAGEQFLLKVDAQNNYTGTIDYTSTTNTPILRMGLYYDVSGVRTTAATTDVNPYAWSGSPNGQNWATFSLVFDANSVPASIGHMIGVELQSVLPTPDRSWIGLDNVRLDVLVPEPGTIALLGLGALTLALARRRA